MFCSLDDAKNNIDRHMIFYFEGEINSPVGYVTPRKMCEKWRDMLRGHVPFISRDLRKVG